MGRSVMVPSDAELVFYFPFEEGCDDAGEYDEYLARMCWDDLIVNLRGVFRSLDDTFEDADEWRHREMHLISKGERAYVLLSEYCGFCSLSLVPCDTPEDDRWYVAAWSEFVRQWLKDNADTIECELRGIGLKLYSKLGTFSNGESVYTASV